MWGVEVQRRDQLSRPESEDIVTQVAARHVQRGVRDRARDAVLQFGAPVDQQVGSVCKRRGRAVSGRYSGRRNVRHRSPSKTLRSLEANLSGREPSMQVVPHAGQIGAGASERDVSVGTNQILRGAIDTEHRQSRSVLVH